MQQREVCRYRPTPAFADAFNPNQPRGKDGRWISAGSTIGGLVEMAGANAAIYFAFGRVRCPAMLSKMLGVNVRGFRHGVSNQSLRHALAQHGQAVKEQARGQKPITRADFALIPQIISRGTYHPARQRPFGPRRVQIRAQIGGAHYTYIAEARPKKRRLDMVTMWKR